jgi:uncharacterized membrane protein YozB (DUF420 family)
LYLSILLTHTVLAALVPFLAGITLYRGLKGDFAKHKRIAQFTLPIWLYVSVTGVDRVLDALPDVGDQRTGRVAIPRSSHS